MTEDTGDITMAVSAERQSLFCQREKLKADTESTSATTPLKKPSLRLEAVEPRRKSRNIASAITRKTKNKVIGFTSKAGNVFDACLKYENEQISFDFDNPGETSKKQEERPFYEELEEMPIQLEAAEPQSK